MSDGNEKATAMGDTDLTGFLERQEIRDIAFNEKISQNAKDIASLTSAVRAFAEDRTKLFDLHNENISDRLKSGKEQWRTVMQGLGVAAIIMTAILAPLAYNITANKGEIQRLRESDTVARVERAVITERHRQEMRLARAWVGDNGEPAFPNPTD